MTASPGSRRSHRPALGHDPAIVGLYAAIRLDALAEGVASPPQGIVDISTLRWTGPASVVPEPGSAALLGLVGVAAMLRRRRGSRRPRRFPG